MVKTYLPNTKFPKTVTAISVACLLCIRTVEKIVLGIVDWNEERYSKQGTGKRGNGRTTGAAVEQK